ncbi:MAG: hypothetical protein JNK07_16500 [Alphaproteobacteria bacterium]|nr:hypothetical protein [Alphaproteobacteria bacterium]
MVLKTTALLLAFGASASAAWAVTYGALAPGAISTAEQSGVRAEICRDHLLDPAHAKMKLPATYSLPTAERLSTDDPALAAFLKASPQYASYFVGSLCFMLSDNFDVDGVRAIASGRPAPMAFWWVRAERTGAADPRMMGKAQWVQIASWYPQAGAHRARITKTDPMAQYVDVDVAETKPGTWRARLKLAGEIVEASIEVTGEPIKRTGPEPRFMTVAFSDNAAGYFTVFTYFGHHHQSAQGTWTATGDGPFAKAFGIPGEASAFDTFFQNRWQARSGLYKFGE